jgi:hypothetical protein
VNGKSPFSAVSLQVLPESETHTFSAPIGMQALDVNTHMGSDPSSKGRVRRKDIRVCPQ